MYVNAPAYKQVVTYSITGPGAFAESSRLDLESDMPEGWVDMGSEVVVSQGRLCFGVVLMSCRVKPCTTSGCRRKMDSVVSGAIIIQVESEKRSQTGRTVS